MAPPVKPAPGCWAVNPPAWGLGAPCLDNEKAFIFACMSEFRPLARVGKGPGLLAAFVGPSGADEGLIVEVMLLDWVVNVGGLVGDCGVAPSSEADRG